MCRTDFTQFRTNSTNEYICVYILNAFRVAVENNRHMKHFPLFAFSHSSPKNREFENPKERSTFCQIYVALETDCWEFKKQDFNLLE